MEVIAAILNWNLIGGFREDFTRFLSYNMQRHLVAMLSFDLSL